MTYNSSDYSEIFCQSVSQIVKGEIDKLGYDVSGEYTVIAIKDRNLGQYQLSDGSAKFIATAAEGAYYEVGDRVIATVPQGDYNKQISILTKIYDEWSGPVGFVRPLDTVVRCTENIVLELKTAGLSANDKNKKYVELFQLSDQKFIGFQKIGISAQFKTLLSGLNVVKGSYGLKFTLQKINEEKIVKQLDFLFSSDEMLGNPYEFTTYFPQEYAFNIPENFDQVDRIIVGFYQDGQFKDGNGNLIESLAGLNNLFIKDLEIYFGYDATREVNEIVELSCDNLTYTGNDSRDVTLRWYHKTSANSMEHINYNRFKENDSPYSVRWYQYWPGATDEEKDEYGGDNWKCFNKTMPGTILNNYPESFTFTMRGQRTTERIKAICFIETHPLVNDETYIVYEQYPSKELVFTNVNEITSGGEAIQEIVNEGFSLQFTDNSFGNYFIYDQNNKIIDVNDLSKPRSIQLLYKGSEINEDNVQKDLNLTVKWEYPKDDNTMLFFSKDEPDTGYELSYSILDEWNVDKGNNTIKCIISVQGVSHTLQETLRFGKQGTNGTTNTFLLEMLNGKNALVADSDDKTLRIQAILIRSNGKRVCFTEESLKDNPIAWSLVNKNNGISISESEDNSDIITLSWIGGEDLPNDNYTILKASYTYGDSDSPKLEAYLPIPIRKTNYINISGATQIIYNHQGIPKYDNGTYIVYDENYKEIKNGWSLKGEQENPNNPILKNSTEMGGGFGLSAAPLYSKRISDKNVIQDKVCVYCNIGTKEEPNIVWSQPILIMQSPYDFAMLNSWDGSLTLDENNGTILSTMLGAGRKNEQNQFSGVLIGDLQSGTDLEETETMTGVYGLQNGIITYGLRENGSAFFGAYNKGRIEIDGTSGIIRSTDENGMIIDLDDGNIISKKFNLTAGDNVNGKISISNNSFEVSKDNDKISFSASDGLNISAKNFNLVAGDATSGKIIITNNSFEVGKDDDKISFSAGNGLNISAKNFNLSAGEWVKGRVEINSNPGNGGYYFAAGLDNYFGEGAFGNTNERYFTIGPNNFEIKTPNFWIKTDGSVQIKGHITATGGTIGKCVIDKDGKLFVPAAQIDGQLIADQIDATNLAVNAANITGTLDANIVTIKNLTVGNANITTLNVSKLTGGENNNNLIFNNGNFRGSITGSSGEFGGVKLDTNGISAVSGGYGLRIKAHVIQLIASNQVTAEIGPTKFMETVSSIVPDLETRVKALESSIPSGKTYTVTAKGFDTTSGKPTNTNVKLYFENGLLKSYALL